MVIDSLPNSISSALSSKSIAILEHEIQVQDIVDAYARIGIKVEYEFGDLKKIGAYRCQESGLVQFYPVVCGSERLYHQLQRFPWYYIENKNEYTVAAAHIQTDNNILEVGCGHGFFASKVTHAHFTGLEFNNKALVKCKSKGLKVLSESVEIHAIKNKRKYDVVCAFQVIEHVDQADKFLNSMLECLKPGGKLIFSVPSDDSFAKISPCYTLNLPPHHITRWPNSAIKFLQKIFSIRLIELHTGTLQQIHFEHYANSMSQYMACCDLNLPYMCLSSEQYSKVLQHAQLFFPAMLSKVRKEYKTIQGHDVTAIFIKN